MLNLFHFFGENECYSFYHRDLIGPPFDYHT